MEENNTNQETEAEVYAETLATQFRKGFLVYCVLVICSHESQYSSAIITRLHQADMVVVEGTIYPLLSRLQKDGLLDYEWRESEAGPPRKYYSLSDFGKSVASHLKTQIKSLNDTLKQLEKGAEK